MVSIISQELMGILRVFSSPKNHQITVVPSVTVSNGRGKRGRQDTVSPTSSGEKSEGAATHFA